MKRFVLASVIVAFIPSLLSAQVPTPSSQYPQEVYPGGERIVEHDLRRYEAGVLQQPVRENRVIKSGLLAPSVQDRSDHRLFLTKRNTGLIRLLPREVYDWRVYKTRPQLDLRGGGAYYSFAFISHEYGWGSDISLDHGNLLSGFAGADIGILADLGDVALESLTLKDPRVKFLSEYKPPTNEPDARVQQRRVRDGFIVDGIIYQRMLPRKLNSTYLVRSVVYRTSDVLVAFRVVREDPNRSLIIAWKMLKEYTTPDLRK